MPVTAPEQELHELLARTIGPACHELRSPLAVVYGFAKMLAGSKSLDETARRYVDSVVGGAQRLDELLDELGGIGRIAGGRQRPQVESIAVREVVERVREQPGNAARVRNAGGGDDVHVKVDPEWAVESLAAIIDALCVEEGATMDVDWTSSHSDVQVWVRPRSATFTIDVSPEKSSLRLAHARMRARAMGGSLDGEADGAVRLVLPR
jgi:K+-sensing histidine kinase KdpD